MPTSDFSSHDPDFSSERRAQGARIIEALRKINTKIVRLGGSLAALTAAGDRAESLLASLGEVTRTRAIESYRFRFNPDEPNDVIPFNPATGEFNPIAPRVEMTLEGTTVVARCEFTNCYEGAPETVQGGMVSAVYDQLLAYAVMARGQTGPTLWIKVSFLKPTPINEPLRFECVVDSIEGRKFMARGSCHHGDERVSEAEALILGSYEVPLAGRGDE